MSDGLLPPLVLELRGRASQLLSELKKAEVAVKTTAAESEKSASRSEAAWARMQGAGKAAAIGLVGVAGLVGYESLKMAGDFQAQINRLETAAGESHRNLQTVADGVLQVARDTGTSTTELTAGMYQIESASFHGTDGLKVLTAAAEGAKNEGADLGGVANALTTVMNDLGAKSGQAADLMSQMVAAVGQGKMKMDDLAGSIHSVLPNAAALGITFPQVAGALATMTAQGVSADQAAQNLNHTIVKLAAPTTAMSNAMAAYGVNANDLKNNLGKNGLTGTFDILSKAILDHMGPAGLALMDTFNRSKTAAADVQKMLVNLPPSIQAMARGFLDGSVGMNEFRKAGKEMGAAGSAQVAQFMKLAQQANGFSDALKSGKSDAQTFSQAMYSMLGDQTGLQVALHLTGEHMEAFKNNVDVIGKATAQADGHVKDWSVTQGNFNTQMGRLRETVQTAAISIGQKLLPPVTKFVGFLADHPTTLKVFAGILGGALVVAAAAYTVSMISAAAATVAATWPILAIIAAVGLVVFAIYELVKHWKTVWGFIKRVAGDVWDWMKGLWRWFDKTFIHPFMDGLHQLGKIFSAVWDGIKTAAGAVWDFLKRAWAWIYGTFIQPLVTIVKLLGQVWDMVWRGGIQPALSAVWGFMKQVWAWIENTFIEPLKVAVRAAGDAWQQTWQMIGDALSWVWNNVIKPVGQWITNNVLHPVGDAISWLGGVWKQIWDGISGAISWAYHNVIKPVADWIGSHVVDPIAGGVQWLGGIWSGVWDGITGAVRTAWNIISGIVNSIVNAVDWAVRQVQNLMSAMDKAKSQGGAGGIAVTGLQAMGWLPKHDKGGWIEGPPGAPIPIEAHGQEYMLSREMLAGTQPIDPRVLASVAAHGQQRQPSMSAQALTGGGHRSPATTGPQVVVNAHTNASPHRIGAEVGWVLRAMA